MTIIQQQPPGPAPTEKMSQPEKRPRGRPPSYTDEERLQRKRELARLRQARKRERDRVRRWSTGHEGEEMGSQGIESPPENSVNGTDTSMLSQKTDRNAWGLEKAVGFQVRVRGGARDDSPSDRGYSAPGCDGGIMPGVQCHDLPPSRPVPRPSPPQSAAGALPLPPMAGDSMICDQQEGYDGGHVDDPVLWHKMESVSRAVEASRGSETMRQQLTGVLYTNEFVSLIDSWEEAGFMPRGKAPLHLPPPPSPPPPPPPQISEQQTGIPTALPCSSSSREGNMFSCSAGDSRADGSEDELMDRILDNLGERMQALKRRKGLKSEVDELRMALADKEAKLKECNAILETERAVWQNFRNIQV